MSSSPPHTSLGLTIDETAAALGVSKRTVERWIAGNLLVVYRQGRVVRVPFNAIEQLREQGTTTPTAVAPAAAAPRPARPKPKRGRPVRPDDRLWRD